MDITTKERKSDEDEKDNGYDDGDGDTPMPDATVEPRSTASLSESVHVSPLLSTIDWDQHQNEEKEVTMSSPLPSTTDHTQNQNEEKEITMSPTLPSTIDQDQNQNEEKEIIMTPLDWKNEGNVRFGKEDWGGALYAYRSGLVAILRQTESTQQEATHDDTASNMPRTATSSLVVSSPENPLEIALRSNIVYVLLKLQQYDRSEEECNQLLSISPQNSKGTIDSYNLCRKLFDSFFCNVFVLHLFSFFDVETYDFSLFY